MNSIDDNKARVGAFFEAMNSGDVAAIAASYAEDGRLQTMGNTAISGVFNRAEITAAAAGIYQVFPDGIAFTVDGMTAEGDRVAVEARSVGRHVSGRIYRNQYHFLFTFSGDKISCLKEYMDTEQVTEVICGGQRAAEECSDG